MPYVEGMETSDSSVLMRVLKGLIRPLVRTLISRGITAPAFYRLLKSVYVDVAYNDFRIDDAPPTDSRVSVLTGVHRRDVRAILSDPDEEWQNSRTKVAVFATVMGQWLSRPAFLTPDGQPRPLPRSGSDGVDFDALVQSVSRDIRPRTILDELLRQGLVEEGDDGLLRIVKGAVVGSASDEHKIIFFAANVGDHLAAASENLLSPDPPFLERAVFYNRLSSASVDAIEAKARELSQETLEELNAEGSTRQQADRGTPDNHERFRFGMYFYRESSVETDGDTKKDNTSEPD